MTRTTTRLAVAVIAVAAVTIAACGSTDTTAGTTSAPRTVDIEMRDIAFSTDKVDVKAGETIRFVFRNKGAVTHDAFIGDEAAQEDHEMEMRQMGSTGGMGGDQTDKSAITVMPGKTGELTRTFAKGDQLLIGCHEEGHYAAGMRITLNVT